WDNYRLHFGAAEMKKLLLSTALYAGLLGASLAQDMGSSGGSVTAAGIITACSASNGQFLFDNAGSCTGKAAIASVTFQSFTTSANSTYTPNANLLFALVECVGQGGGGGGAAASATGSSSGGGGGAGSYSRVRLTAAQIGASQAVTNTA